MIKTKNNLNNEGAIKSIEQKEATNYWLDKIIKKNNPFINSEMSHTLYPSEIYYTEISLTSKLSHMVEHENKYIKKHKVYNNKSWSEFIKVNNIILKGARKKTVKIILKDLYFNSETFRRMFNSHTSQNKKLEIIFPSSDTHYVRNNYKNRSTARQVHVQELPIVDKVGVHNCLSHELVHAFTHLEDYPRYHRFLVLPEDKEGFKMTFPGPVELINHQIAVELEKNEIGVPYTLLPYGSKARIYKGGGVAKNQL